MRVILFHLLYATSIIAMQQDGIIKKENLLIPMRLESLQLQYKDNHFFVIKGEDKHQIACHNIDKFLRDITTDQLKKILKAGSSYLFLNATLATNNQNQEYILKFMGRLR